jgi:hypothetical protein
MRLILNRCFTSRTINLYKQKKFKLILDNQNVDLQLYIVMNVLIASLKINRTEQSF